MRYKHYRVGVLSDTHGILDAWVLAAFANVDHIIHAGDVVSAEIIPILRKIAPVTVVAGNMDGYSKTNQTAVATVGDVDFLVLHDLDRLDMDPAAAGFAGVIHGHTHRASVSEEGGVLYFNPGSAAFPRGGAVPSVGIIEVDGTSLRATILDETGQWRSA